MPCLGDPARWFRPNHEPFDSVTGYQLDGLFDDWEK